MGIFMHKKICHLRNRCRMTPTGLHLPGIPPIHGNLPNFAFGFYSPFNRAGKHDTEGATAPGRLCPAMEVTATEIGTTNCAGQAGWGATKKWTPHPCKHRLPAQ